MADIKLEGLDELLEKVGKLGGAGREIKRNTLGTAAELVKRSMEETAPRSYESSTHMADHISISKMEESGGVSYVKVGPGKGDNSPFFYSKFTEWGTSKIPARHWAEGSVQKNKKKIKDIIFDELKRRLDAFD